MRRVRGNAALPQGEIPHAPVISHRGMLRGEGQQPSASALAGGIHRATGSRSAAGVAGGTQRRSGTQGRGLDGGIGPGNACARGFRGADDGRGTTPDRRGRVAARVQGVEARRGRYGTGRTAGSLGILRNRLARAHVAQTFVRGNGGVRDCPARGRRGKSPVVGDARGIKASATVSGPEIARSPREPVNHRTDPAPVVVVVDHPATEVAEMTAVARHHRGPG